MSMFKEKICSSGFWTLIARLEGNNANHYTTVIILWHTLTPGLYFHTMHKYNFVRTVPIAKRAQDTASEVWTEMHQELVNHKWKPFKTD